MKIAIGSDHAGYPLKESVISFLTEMGHDVNDCGCHDLSSVDYPDYAHCVGKCVQDGSAQTGILICGTGIGMSLAANHLKGIRAALCHNEFTARLSRQHNDANILCMGARVIGLDLALEMVRVFLQTEFEGGRHSNRVAKIEE